MNRFNRAVEKLYKAFNEGTLDAFNCQACAVGNLVSKEEARSWAIHTFRGENLKGSSWFRPPIHKEYTEEELTNIERIFLGEFRHLTGVIDGGKDKEAQFNGLIAVINYLAELDGIETIESQYKQFKEVLERETITV